MEKISLKELSEKCSAFKKISYKDINIQDNNVQKFKVAKNIQNIIPNNIVKIIEYEVMGMNKNIIAYYGDETESNYIWILLSYRDLLGDI